MVFIKGHPTRGGKPQPDWRPGLAMKKRSVVQVQCEDCDYHRTLDSAEYPDIRPTIGRETAKAHCRTHKHNLIYTFIKTERFLGRNYTCKLNKKGGGKGRAKASSKRSPTPSKKA